MDFERQLDDVVNALQKAKDDGIKVNLLIGAGCSVTGNIPTADGLVEKIKALYPRDYERANPKDYGTCMSKLTPFERRNLIKNIVDESQINWAHIAIAQLLKHNFVSRIITTNFDNLVQRACSLVGEYPAIYDLTTSNEFRTDLLFEKSVLHLHGQHTGFILCNTGEEVESQADRLKPIFEQLNQNSLWIILGYSGNNDPIFKLLSEKELFEYRLFWVGYKNNKPSENLKNKLLSDEKYAFFVRGYDADSFFVSLSQKLGCFPPNFIRTPFTYLSDTLESIAVYTSPKLFLPDDLESKIHSGSNMHLATKRVVEKAIASIEKDNTLMAEHYLFAGLLEEVIKLDGSEQSSRELEELIISALIERGEEKDLGLAETKLKKLIENENSATSYFQLTSVYMRKAFSKKEEVDFGYLVEAFNQCKIGLEIDPQLVPLVMMNSLVDSFFSLQGTPRLKNNIEMSKIEDMVLTFVEIIDKHYVTALENFPSSERNKKFLSLQFIYELILAERFNTAEVVLVTIEKYQDIMGDEFAAYVEADWGFWYFTNSSLEPEIAEDNGIDSYQNSIKIIEENKPFGVKNDSAVKAFKQKFRLEYAKFLFRFEGKEEDATRQLLEAYSYGESDFTNTILDEVVDLIDEKDLWSLIEAPTEVAPSNDSN